MEYLLKYNGFETARDRCRVLQIIYIGGAGKSSRDFQMYDGNSCANFCISVNFRLLSQP